MDLRAAAKVAGGPVERGAEELLVGHRRFRASAGDRVRCPGRPEPRPAGCPARAADPGASLLEVVPDGRQAHRGGGAEPDVLLLAVAPGVYSRSPDLRLPQPAFVAVSQGHRGQVGP